MLNKQDYINAVYQDVEMVKGDTLAFNFSLKGLDGGEPSFKFSCKEHYDDTITLFECESGFGIELADYNEAKDISTFAVWVDPAKTKNLDLARYYYDLEMSLNDDVITLMRGRLTLVYEVTKGV